MTEISVAERVTQLRNSKGWTQAELARRAGISTTHLSDIEAGQRRPSLEVVGKLAFALEVSVTSLFLDTDSAQSGKVRDENEKEGEKDV